MAGPWILAVWALLYESPWDRPTEVFHFRTYEECRAKGMEFHTKQHRQFECIDHEKGTSCRNMQCT